MKAGNRDWTDATLEHFRDLTPTVREFTLRPAGDTMPWDAGSHLQVQVLVDGRPQTRSYSLTSRPEEPVYRIAVKRLDQGRGGSRAMWSLVPGDRLAIAAPANHFPLDLAAPACLLVAGGIGVTPLLHMAAVLAARGSAVRMLYGARGADEFAYGDELAASLGPALRRFDDTRGERIDFTAEIARLPAGGQMYMCGPIGMLEAARHAWAAAGRPLAELRYETFGSSGRLPTQPFRLRLPRHALDITVPAETSLLESLEAAGVQVMSDCRRGECGLCALDVLAVEGEIDHRDVFLSAHEKSANRRICACVSRVVGDITLDSAWRGDEVPA